MSLRDEIREQPEVIRRTIQSVIANLATIQSQASNLKARHQIVITGMGGSFAAGTLCQLILSEGGINALTLESSELLYHYRPLLDSQPVIIMISQSGESGEIVRLIAELQKQSNDTPIIGITNAAGSTLATKSTYSLLIQAGAEKTVSSKTYTCTLAALVMLGSALIGGAEDSTIRSLEQAAGAIETALPEWEERAKTIAEHVHEIGFMEFLGRGVSRASALTGALITKETAKLPTEGMVGGQFRHGPIEVLAPNTAVTIFTGSGMERDLNEILAKDIENHNAPVIRIGSDVQHDLGFNLPPVDELVRPMVEIIPVQLLAAELAALRGFPVGEFRYGTKVTTTE